MVPIGAVVSGGIITGTATILTHTILAVLVLFAASVAVTLMICVPNQTDLLRLILYHPLILVIPVYTIPEIVTEIRLPLSAVPLRIRILPLERSPVMIAHVSGVVMIGTDGAVVSGSGKIHVTIPVIFFGIGVRIQRLS
jgi:hypothetical protein